MTVLERQQERFKWVQQQQQQLQLHSYVNQQNSLESCSMLQFRGHFDYPSMNGDTLYWKNKSDMYVDNGNDNLPKLGNLSVAETKLVVNKVGFAQAEAAKHYLETEQCLSRTYSCQMGIAEAAKMEEDVVVADVTSDNVALIEKMQSNHGRYSSNKRKAESIAAEFKDKKTKEVEVAYKVIEKSGMQILMDSTKDNKKTYGFQKTDCRGQPTDSHSLAERARRENISKKMKSLQDLVPGCNKITGRAGMLDEIINYVQSLQRQVEFLSMKLAALNPRLDFPAYDASFQTAAMSTAIGNLPQLQVNLVQQHSTGSESDILANPPQLVLERTTSCSGFIPEICPDLSCFPVQPFWDSDSQKHHGFHRDVHQNL